MPDLSAARPTSTHDGAAVLSERFAARSETLGEEPTPVVPVAGMSVAARLIASWFAPVAPADADQ